MNVATTKIEDAIVDDSVQTRLDSSPGDSTKSAELTDESISSDQEIERRLYRRSVAYFFFGFGSSQNTILTDEP